MHVRRCLAAAAAAVLVPALGASAAAVDFNLFTGVQGIRTTFPNANWQVVTEYAGFPVPSGAVAIESANADTTFFMGPDTITTLGKKVSFDLYAGGDDDYVGIGIGLSSPNPLIDPAADFLLLQWKGVNQDFDWADADPAFPFHNLTPSSFAPAGLSLSRVSGVVTADELWGRTNFPLIDPGTGLPIEPDSGGVEELGRGAFYGTRGYNTLGGRHQFKIEYTSTNLKVWVDGSLEFDIDAPLDRPFTDGTVGMYEQAQSPSGAYAFLDVRDISEPDADPNPLLVRISTAPFAAAEVAVAPGTSNGASVWTIASSTAGFAVDTGANVGDVEFSVDGQKMNALSSVFMATVSQNGPRYNGSAVVRHAVAEAAAPSGFGGGSGVNTIQVDTGGEYNINAAVGNFPFAAGFKGGYVNAGGNLVWSNNGAGPASGYIVSELVAPLPSIVQWAADPFEVGGDGLPNELFFAGNQQFLTQMTITGANSQTGGLLFVASSRNEDNRANVTPLADGSWMVAVRDADSQYYGAADTFERDNFGFLYLSSTDIAASVGGRVTDGSTLALQQQWGAFALDRVGTGRYQLSVDGGQEFVIELLQMSLVGGLTFEDVDTNSDGTPDDRVFTDTQNLVPVLADAPFSFAYIPYIPGNAAQGMLLLNGNGSLTLSDGTVAPASQFMTYGRINRWTAGSGVWSAASNWRGGAVGGGELANVRITGSAIAEAAQTITLSDAIVVDTIDFDSADSYTVSGGGSITLGGTSARALMSSGGTHEIAVPVVFNKPVIAGVESGSALRLSGGYAVGTVATGGATLTKQWGGTLEIATPVTLDAIAVEGGTLALSGSTGNLVKATTINAGALLAVDAASLLLDYAPAEASPLADVIAALADARLGTTVAGRAVGYAEASVLLGGAGVFDAVAIDDSTLIVAHTFAGDTNLDRQVDVTDLGSLATNWQAASNWSGGDFNHDGLVDVSDLGLLASFWQAGVTGPSAYDATPFLIQALVKSGLPVSVVPEPSMLGLALVGGLALRRRRA